MRCLRNPGELTSLILFVFFLFPGCNKKRDIQSTQPVTAAAEAIMLSPEKQPPPLVVGALEPLQVTFKGCDTIGGDLVFRFSLPMVESDSLSTALFPKISFSPELTGQFRWNSPTELIFSPAPGSMVWGQYFSVSIDSAVPLAGETYELKGWDTSFEVPYFRMAGKIASWPIYKGKPRFVAFLNWHSNLIGIGPLLLLFDQKCNAQAIIPKIKAHDSEGNALSIKVFRPDSVDMSIDTNLTVEYVIALQLEHIPEHGQNILIEIPSYETPDSEELIQRELQVNTHFSTLRWGDDYYSFDENRQEHHGGEKNQRIRQRAPLHYQWSAVFDNNFSLSELKKVLRINPQPISMSLSGFSDYNYENGNYAPGVSISFQLNPGTMYKLSIPGTFKDVLGNALNNPIHTWFRTVDLEPSLELPSDYVLIEQQQNSIPVKVRNIKNMRVRVYSWDSPSDFASVLIDGKKRTMHDYGISGEIDSLPFTYTSPDANIRATIDIPLGERSGLFCVEVTGEGTGSLGGGSRTDAVLVQRSNMAVTAKILQDKVFTWVTHLDKGTVVEDAKLSLYVDGNLVQNGVTDPVGVGMLVASGVASAYGLNKPCALIAKKESDVAVAVFTDEKLAQPWQFGIKGTVEGFQPLHASVFTERGVYRPGDSVYVKVITSTEEHTDNRDIQVDIKDSRGQQVLSKNVMLNVYHSAYLTFQLKEQAPVGEYTIHVSRNKRSVSARFRVEEYRVPSFKVTVTSDDTQWRLGEKIQGTVVAKYLHGGTLDGREARWEIIRSPASFAPAGFEKYAFSFKDLLQTTGTVESGSKRLNGQGQLRIDFQPNHSSAIGPMLYTIEATVTDVDRQAYAGRISKVVHPADFYIGIRPPPRAVIKAGEKITIPVVALSAGEKLQSGIRVQAVLERVDYHTAARVAEEGSVDMLNRPVAVPLDYQEITTAGTPVSYTLQVPSAGSFRLRVWAKDSKGRTVQTGFPFTASGNNITAWPRYDQDIVEVVADKQEYAPGEKATLIVQSPFKKAEGLVTIEGDGWVEYLPFKIKNNTPSITIPIKDSYTPNVFVSVMLIRGRIHTEKDASGFETGAPGFKIGYRNIRVTPRERKLDLVVNSEHTVAQPGQKIRVTFSVNDFKGNPAESQVTCMVVDEAVLGLTGYKTPDPLAAIFAERSLGVRTGTSVLDLPNAKRSRLEAIFPSGDMDKSDQIMEYSEALRKLFKSTAYWNPGIQVGTDGKASVEFELPDNLTTYRVMAVVVDTRGRLGSADKQIMVKKPLMIQAVTPRFVYPGDELQIEALLYNGTRNAGEVSVNCSCTGMDVSGARSLQKSIKPDGSVSFPFTVKVNEKGKAIVTFTATMGNVKDAVEVTIPVLEPGNRRTEVQSGSKEMIVNIPQDRIPGTARMEVVVSNTALSELKDAVQFLMHYPNGCIEQTTSTAYPLVVLKDLLPIIGAEVNMADLKKFSEAGIRRILSFQTPSGGLSYWPDGKQPHAFATAFGLTALIAAKERGYDVPDKALGGMADYLEASLREGKITGEMPHGGMADADTRALFVMTLGRLGRPQQGYISELWNKRSHMTPFGLSFLALAVKEFPGDQSLLEPILAEITKAAKQDQKEAWYEGSREGGWSMGSPLRTHAAALLATATAGNAMTPKYLAGLLKRRVCGMWGNTQENVFGIMGVHAASTGNSGSDKGIGMVLTVNGKIIDEKVMERNSPQVKRLTLLEPDLMLNGNGISPQKIHLEQPDGSVVYLTSRLQYDIPLTEENRKAYSNGFTLTRTYETPEGKSIEGKGIKLGSLVRVRLHIKTDASSHYVACDDKLPAGLEPLNTSLETTERVSRGKLTQTEQRSLSVLSYNEIRDSRVAFFIDEMLPGEYEYTYLARATTPGTFLRPAGRIEAMYEPERCGTTAIDIVTITPEK